MQLEGRVALITGAGSGIGKAAALLLAREGAKIGALSREADEVEKVVQEIQAAGGEALPLVADISQPDDMQQAVKQLAGRWGRIDIVFANAGINGVWTPIEELQPEEWDRTLNINLKGTYLTVHYAIPHLRKAGGGSVIINSSVGRRVNSPIMMTTPTVPLRCSPSPLPTRRSIFGTSGPAVVPFAAFCAAAFVMRCAS